jgi:hypothetical protein
MDSLHGPAFQQLLRSLSTDDGIKYCNLSNETRKLC